MIFQSSNTEYSCAMLLIMKLDLMSLRKVSGNLLSRFLYDLLSFMFISGVTEKFQKISKEIIQIKETLAKDHSDTKLSHMIERVQVQGYSFLHSIIYSYFYIRTFRRRSLVVLWTSSLPDSKLWTTQEMICARRMLTL